METLVYLRGWNLCVFLFCTRWTHSYFCFIDSLSPCRETAGLEEKLGWPCTCTETKGQFPFPELAPISSSAKGVQAEPTAGSRKGSQSCCLWGLWWQQVGGSIPNRESKPNSEKWFRVMSRVGVFKKKRVEAESSHRCNLSWTQQRLACPYPCSFAGIITGPWGAGQTSMRV